MNGLMLDFRCIVFLALSILMDRVLAKITNIKSNSKERIEELVIKNLLSSKIED